MQRWGELGVWRNLGVQACNLVSFLPVGDHCSSQSSPQLGDTKALAGGGAGHVAPAHFGPGEGKVAQETEPQPTGELGGLLLLF